MFEVLQSLLLLVVSVLFLFVVIGVVKCKNTLEMLHFLAVIEIICMPLVLLFAAIYCYNILFAMLIILLLSPLTSYFIGKSYYIKHCKNNFLKNE